MEVSQSGKHIEWEGLSKVLATTVDLKDVTVFCRIRLKLFITNSVIINIISVWDKYSINTDILSHASLLKVNIVIV